ncbi:MAG: hypothetical protein Fur0025_47950 [Oscillatoriaceae cyanobacterium]
MSGAGTYSFLPIRYSALTPNLSTRKRGCDSTKAFDKVLYLIPALKPGQVVVIDNATFHKGGRLQELILGAGCRLLYLPPYSRDLNKIERCWSWLKARIRKCLNQSDSLHNAIDHVLAFVS